LEAVAHQARSRDRTVPKDSLLNRCLEHIERVRSLIPVELLENNPILEEYVPGEDWDYSDWRWFRLDTWEEIQ